MNKEHKVIAWNGEKMSEPINPYCDNSFWFSDDEGDAVFVNDAEVNGLEIFEYIGLKDVNGQDIYDGHILQPSNGENKYYVVVWKDCGFKLAYNFIRKFEGKFRAETTYATIYRNSFKIVGHIKENPEFNLINRS